MKLRFPVAAAVASVLPLAAVTAADAQFGRGRAMIVDPACLAPVPWAVNPAESDLQLIGCRPVRQIPAPDAEGWRSFEAPDGSKIDVHSNVVWNPRSREITFQLRYNGGGSFTFAYTISGQPVVAGRLKAGSFTVK